MSPISLFPKHLEDCDVLFICWGGDTFIPEAVAIFGIQLFILPLITPRMQCL